MGNFISALKSSAKRQRKSNIQNAGTIISQPESVFVGKCDFDRPDCVGMFKNDQIEIIDDNEHEEFIYVKNKTSGETGYVPKKLLVYEKSLESEEWFYGNVSRAEVTSRLLTKDDEDGTYLVRSTNKTHPYVLSIKTKNDGKYVVKHFRIFRDENNQFFVSPEQPFVTIGALITSYSSEYSDYISMKLTNPCRKKQIPIVHELSPLYSLHWEIPPSEIKRGNKIGSGQFSNVFKGKWKTKDVAIKEIAGYNKVEIMNEISIMKKLRHRNVAIILGYTLNNPLWIIAEYVLNGDLKSYLQKNDLLEQDLIYIAFQIADGMQYLSSRNIIHRDLAARNLLVADDLLIKINDFGLSRVQNENGIYIMQTDVKLPMKWAAPELLTEDECSPKVDIWSYGIVIIELFTRGGDPYADCGGLNITAIFHKIRNGYRMTRPNSVPENIYSTVCMPCWNTNPKQRPTFQELKLFFEEYNVE